jgi:hypothetical protein
MRPSGGQTTVRPVTVQAWSVRRANACGMPTGQADGTLKRRTTGGPPPNVTKL